jgi:transcriptional regulator with XRE-family HTH domain
MGYSPEPAQPFGEWLDRTIKATDYSRARLTRETEISDGALRNYLANKTMPDADQARKIVDALQADAYEVAHLIVANTVAKKGGTLAQAEATAMQAGATIAPLSLNQDAPSALSAEFAASAGSAATVGGDEAALLSLWRQLHPQGRRATLSYIAMLLAER